MPRVLLALGSNLGDRGAILDAAMAAMEELAGTQLLARSSWHATRPVGGPSGQGEFLNGAVLMETDLAPADLQRELHSIEQRLGRERTERWAARTLDVDILLYDEAIIDQPHLKIPHPRMSFRPFVLAPAAEIAADMVHPELGVSIGTLWHHLRHAEDVVVICGGVADDRRRMFEGLLGRFPPHSLASLSEFPASQWQLFPALRILGESLVSDSFMYDRHQRMLRGREPGTALPKLQIFLAVPDEPWQAYLQLHGGLYEHEQWQRLREVLSVPDLMSQRFIGIPTLMLDPRDDPAQLLTEAAAALEAVWPDLCQTAP